MCDACLSAGGYLSHDVNFVRNWNPQVDKNMRLVRAATKNAALNGLSLSTTFAKGHVLPFAQEVLGGGAARGWDLVIVDPPSALKASRSESSDWSLARATEA